VTYLVELDGRRIAFTGDLIYGPGQIWEMYSLQNRYREITVPHLGFGAEGEKVFASLGHVLEADPHLLIPSHGVVMRDPAAAAAQARRNFDAVMDNYLTTVGWPDFGQPRLARQGYNWAGTLEASYPEKKLKRLPPLPPAAYPSWIRDVTWTTQAIVGDNQAVFLSDAGKSGSMDVVARLKEMIETREIRGVEGVWPTHYHSDHSELLERVRAATGAKVYVQREMVDIIENPHAYGMPYMSSVAAKVDHSMEHRQSINWRGVKLTFYHFPGQTLYHGGLLAEKDGFKAFFTGDSWANWGIEDYCSYFRCFLGADRGFDQCLKILLECKPDILVQAHRGPMKVTEEYVQRTLAIFQQREALARRLLPHDDPNFGLDPYWVSAYPYRQHAAPGAEVNLEARITNHATKPRSVRVELRLPKGWKVLQASGVQSIPARSEGRVSLRAIAPADARGGRQVLGLAVTADGQPFGELAEALVDLSRE
jgi:glyoxylase-like metal-dependent hydrolase (beta-lactamase superfamily II)